MLSIWIRARSFLPVQEFHGMAKQDAELEGLRMGQQCQAVSLCPKRLLQWPVTEYKEQENHYSLLLNTCPPP